jgi:ankyrin repeat protein
MSNDRFTNPDLAPLADAVARGDGAEIRRQAANVDPDTPGGDGATLLVEAIGQGSLESVQALLEAGADPNRPGMGGETPVHAAAFAKDPQLLRAVLAQGGDPVAARTNAGAAILQLLDKGALPQARNSGGATFQDYYFAFQRKVLNERALAERREVVAWLKAHNVPLGPKVEAVY